MTYPFLHALLFSSWSLIIPTMMSSLTRPPASMIFLASIPSFVFLVTCSRSMSPVARWHTQKSSRIRGACVPFPTHPTGVSTLPERAGDGVRTCAGRAHEDGTQLLRWRLARDRVLRLRLQRLDLRVELRDERLEVLEFVGAGHGGCLAVRARAKGAWSERRGERETRRGARGTPGAALWPGRMPRSPPAFCAWGLMGDASVAARHLCRSHRSSGWYAGMEVNILQSYDGR